MPKGVPLEPGAQHLAVHVEDHPLSYATFEGEIPAGNYGAGTVEIWDRGTYELVEEKPNGGLTVRLHGEKLDGLWTLVPAKLGGDPKNWLLLRKREEGAESARRTYAPMLATPSGTPSGEGWLFEVKWDGFRALATIRGGDVDLRSRNDKSFVERFPTVVRALTRSVRSPDCVLDGEVVAVGRDGRATFSAMQQGKEGTTYLYLAFDLLELEGEPLVDLPLVERRARLAELLDLRPGGVQLSATFEDGDALYTAAQEQRFEGIVAKRADSRYLPAGAAATGSRSRRRGGRSSSSPAGRRGRASAPAASARSSSPSTRAASCAGRATSARASTTPRSTACSGSCARSCARRHHSRSRQDAARPPRRRDLGRAGARRRGALRRVDARRACGRRSTRGCVRTRRRTRCSGSGWPSGRS